MNGLQVGAVLCGAVTGAGLMTVARPQRPRVSRPTLVLWAMDDVALPPSLVDGLEAYIPRLQLERIAGATHWLIHEQPALVNRYLHDFILL